jgi:hypothetical protein
MKAHSRLLTPPRDNLMIRLELIVMAGKQQSPWNGVVSGTTAAILANILVYPLDMYDRVFIFASRSYADPLKCEDAIASSSPKNKSAR